jgi:hypothetical protein
VNSHGTPSIRRLLERSAELHGASQLANEHLNAAWKQVRAALDRQPDHVESSELRKPITDDGLATNL